MNQYAKFFGRNSVGVVLATIALFSNVLAFASEACQKPNPSTRLCADLGTGEDTECYDNGDDKDCAKQVVADIVNFPMGAIDSSSGTTIESYRKCKRTCMCKWNASLGEGHRCEPSKAWSPAEKAKKILVGTNQCP